MRSSRFLLISVSHTCRRLGYSCHQPLHTRVNWPLSPYCLSSSLSIEPGPSCSGFSNWLGFNVNRTIEWELSFLLCLKIAFSEDINYARVYLIPPVLRTTQSHRSTSQKPISLSSSPSMDAFTYIIDVFTVTSDDEGLPTNQEAAGSGAPPPICVIAWFVIAYLTNATPFYNIIVSLLISLDLDVLLMSWISQKHPSLTPELSLS